jgi:hypothetical protein
MGDWIGLGIFAVVIAGAIIGLKIIAKPSTRTSEEFERNAAEGTTMLGATMNALQEIMNPAEAKAKETITQMKEGRFRKKKREGKANAENNRELEETN